MAFPAPLTPSTPIDSATVASIPGFIRAIKQYLADAFGFPTSLTMPAFSITSGGVVTIAQSGALVIADPTAALGIASKQYVDAKAGGAGGGYGSANLGAPVAIGGSTGTILTLGMVAPGSGGPYRLLVSYSVALSLGNIPAVADFQVTDGTNNWAQSEISVTQVGGGGVNGTDISPVTYAAGANVALTLQAKLLSGAALSAVVSNGGLLTTFLRGIFIPAS